MHLTGGIYHVVADRDVATLADDLDESMRPASTRRDCDASEWPVTDLGNESDRPDEDDDEREKPSSSSHRSNTRSMI
ncbi:MULTISPECIES: hypothetical protein [Haloarcula]|uniref:hypothetical protein n=1 Tax=Haloarcula TaxID=2237 RepID=UPI0023EDA701|nr:hypothetical protein [Halomicroarcula sp. XH51]